MSYKQKESKHVKKKKASWVMYKMRRGGNNIRVGEEGERCIQKSINVDSQHPYYFSNDVLNMSANQRYSSVQTES